jgi:cyclic beta-1,2-glucan synthetase
MRDDVRRGEAVPPAAEWLLDNFHLVFAIARSIRHDLPAAYYRRLPRIAAQELAGTARIAAMASELIRCSGGRLEADRLRRFVTAFQSSAPLTIGELWAWPTVLKLGLIEHLRTRAEVLAEDRRHRLLANELADAIASTPARTPLPLDLHPAFVVRLLQRSREYGEAAASLRQDLDVALAARGQSVEDVIRAEGQHQAAEQASIANLIGSLRVVQSFDWSEFFESVSLVEQVLQRDPAAVYRLMDFRSRDRYRQAVEELADPTGESQMRVALRCVERARQIAETTDDPRAAHVGYHLIGRGRRQFEADVAWAPSISGRVRRLLFSHSTLVYLGTLSMCTTLLVAAAVTYASAHGGRGFLLIVTALLALVPASELVIQISQRVISALVPPRRLPRLELAHVPDDAKTMVIVPTLLSTVDAVEDLIGNLEVHALGNLDANIHFAILSDFTDAPTETVPRDTELLAAARAGITSLNERYGEGRQDRFFLFHRVRQWNESEGLWMGWERKRGKIEEFNRLLRGAADTSFVVHVGDLSLLPKVRYCITLDSDTRLPRDVAKELIGIIRHPLHEARFDRELGRVTEGYGILQPRVSVTMASAAGSVFARLYAGHTGVDPYTTAVSDTYQDLFGEGLFTGKGLYDVDAFIAALEEIVPENALLSHDLFEGLHARAAFVSDVELVDEYPSSVLAHAKRQHRWIRGDWQILFWLFPFVPTRHGLKRNRLPLIARWKILDNLRRSLVAPTLLALLVAGWSFLSGDPAVWTGSVVLVFAAQILPLLATFVAGPRYRQPLGVFLRSLRDDGVMALAQACLSLTFLVFHAWETVHAIVLTLVRLAVTRRRLLEWETAATTAARAARLIGRQALWRFMAQMSMSPAVAAAIGIVVLSFRRASFEIAAPFLLLWAAAPAIGYWLSRPADPKVRALKSDERRFLRAIARRTWRYFETFVTAEEHWLPPDNVQEGPVPGTQTIARRTSPTNIGMSLLSTLAARDLGYITDDDFVHRLDLTLGTLESMERHEGHFFNWYDTSTLAPLHPRYVSTVDSGNLAAALMTVGRALQELMETQALETGPPRLCEGLIDGTDALRRATASTTGLGAPLARAAIEINQIARAILTKTQKAGEKTAIEDLTSFDRQLAAAAGSLPGDEDSPSGRDILFWVTSVRRSLNALVEPPPVTPRPFVESLAYRAAALADAMQFGFLYHRHRRIFAIGYRLADADGPGRLDSSYYDLLASEARLASFVAIAKGDVPQQHWFHLGRLVGNVGGKAALLSWGGTMFEYLMPLLFMRSFPGTLLDQSCRACVERQIRYARERRVPWGISESAYAGVDRAGTYQYKSFGVPGLGLKRGLADDIVVSPYATALAAIIDPAAAVENLRRLSRLELEDGFGFREAIDFTTQFTDASPDIEQPGTSNGAVVKAFFAHHQGMSLAALANVIRNDAIVGWFHADPRVKATELLLHERVPRDVGLTEPRPAEGGPVRTAPVLASRRFRSPHTTYPHTHFLSNGNYTASVTQAGGGSSSWRGLVVTRHGDDSTADVAGQFIYLRDPWSGMVWSPTYQPTCREPDAYDVTFDLEKIGFRRSDGDFDTQLQIAVSPEDDVEVRRLAITNRSNRAREIEVTSYAEVVLGRAEDDLAHPAFGKLFVETEYDASNGTLIFSRRPRSSDETRIWAFHGTSVDDRPRGPGEWETDRARFLGRGRSPRDPQALEGRPLTGTTGAVLDPVASLRQRIRLAPGGFARLSFVTGVAADRASLLVLAQKYRDGSMASRAFSMAFTHAQIALRHLGMNDDEAILADRLASRLFGADASCRSTIDLARNVLGQSGLWGYGISGDLPILLIRINDGADLPIVRQVLLAQEYWRIKGLRGDVVILNEHPVEYLDDMQSTLTVLLNDPRWTTWKGRPGGIFLLRSDGMSDADRILLGAVARVMLAGGQGDLPRLLDLAHQSDRTGRWNPLPTARQPRIAAGAPGASEPPAPVERPPLTMDNGLGGFAREGREYVVVLDGRQETPAPWSNVLANPDFGTIVTASGSTFTWSLNSRENRLTGFANDPVTDPTSEAMYLRDEETGSTWGATPGPLPRTSADPGWIVRHTAGVTRFQRETSDLRQELAVFVSPRDPVKCALLTVTNTSSRTRRLGVFGVVEWTLGPPRAGERRFVTTRADESSGVLFAENRYNTEFSTRVAFFGTTESPSSVTCDRAEFVGRNRTLAAPSGILRERLSGRAGAGLDPCAAMHVTFSLAPGESHQIAFALGQGDSAERSRELAQHYASIEHVVETLSAAERSWDATLSAIKVSTPDDSFDLMVNRWLLYQTLSCRIWGRSGLFQPGGAFGFRDQLQDVLALLYANPSLCREHLIRAGSRQFVEGDVQHWWHPPSGRGTRTRCSDDLIWLPYALCAYVDHTADDSILNEVVPFLEGPALEDDQAEIYMQPSRATEHASLFEHAQRAIDHSLKYGAHGLPLIGSGDWNDGMNRVGLDGRGESVWLGWFLVSVLNQFAALCDKRHQHDLALRYRREGTRLTGMLELAWDGEWYRRAYFDDGAPLGSVQNDECRIDSLTQSWAVLSGVAERERASRAMDAVRAHLVRRDAQLVLLLTPPFDRTMLDPGYIKGYLPGIRENGGQYTHAAVWVVMALSKLGLGDEAMELFHMINAVNHTRTPDAVERYRVEPYAIAADLYAHPMHVGRGGWSWYTGSAGWMYRAAVENILGLRCHGTSFVIQPCIPASWPRFEIEWTFRRSRYRIVISNPDHQCCGVGSVELDGTHVDPEHIPLVDDGETHDVAVVLGPRARTADEATPSMTGRPEMTSRAGP